MTALYLVATTLLCLAALALAALCGFLLGRSPLRRSIGQSLQTLGRVIAGA